ncbi:TetR/AcrR family transcriptional regulator [Auritidibacter ignavus]|uniref:TetR/AcrR family transcriptional regulator n=1 Tax=Auritidibacter ignavus TaxID=678932 RepID=UPI0024BB8486|nr:TetR/AcrR family transcriptional regulator [Auritidibacter ignavus]WHS34069.1 TetR/AcrR family transcriptional regulator [Auritidibacter ignavus]
MHAKQARATESYELILHAAAVEFAEKGYSGASITTVAGRAGTQKGNVQYHFRIKADIVAALIERVFEGGRYLGADAESGAHGIAAIIEQTPQVAVTSVRSPFARAAIRLLDERAQIPLTLPTPYVGWIDKIAGHLREAVDDGELAITEDSIPETAWLIVAGFHGVKNVPIQLGQMETIPDRRKNSSKGSCELSLRRLRSRRFLCLET